MIVNKGRVTLTRETTNDYYINTVTIDMSVFEKTDGNYKEIVAKINGNSEETKTVSDGIVVHSNYTADEMYKVYPNMTLEELYTSLLAGYTATYIEPLMTI
jgi:hypothetical protein